MDAIYTNLSALLDLAVDSNRIDKGKFAKILIQRVMIALTGKNTGKLDCLKKTLSRSDRLNER